MGAGVDWFEAAGLAVAGGRPAELFCGAGVALATGATFFSGTGTTVLAATGGGETLLGSGGAT